jgi:hypothetical protein
MFEGRWIEVCRRVVCLAYCGKEKVEAGEEEKKMWLAA